MPFVHPGVILQRFAQCLVAQFRPPHPHQRQALARDCGVVIWQQLYGDIEILERTIQIARQKLGKGKLVPAFGVGGAVGDQILQNRLGPGKVRCADLFNPDVQHRLGLGVRGLFPDRPNLGVGSGGAAFVL